MNTNTTAETLTTPEVRAMVSKWITGNNERDARALKNAFRGLGFTLSQWKQVIAETKASCSCRKGDQGIHRHEDCPVHGADVRAELAARLGNR